MTAEILLSRLEKVQQKGRGRWAARCPAHADRSPSLAITEKDDGKVLMKCFAECSPESILDAVGLRFEDLFGDRLEKRHYSPERVPFPASDVLQALRNEALIVAVAAANVAKGRKLTDADHERLMLAAERIVRTVK